MRYLHNRYFIGRFRTTRELVHLQNSETIRKSTRKGNGLPELLGEIFCDCLPDDYDNRFGNFMSTEAPPLLGQICSRRRSVSVATPGLRITSIALFRQYRRRRPEAEIKPMELWLSRSSSPLWIRFKDKSNWGLKNFIPLWTC